VFGFLMIRILLLTLLLATASAWAVPLDRIVAIVNEDVLLESELEDKEDTVRQQARQRGAGLPPEDILRKQVLERLILQRIQLQEASGRGIRVGDDTLNAALRRIADNNGLTLREFRNVLEDDGFSFIDFRETIREEMIITRLRKAMVEDRVEVSESEVDNYLITQEAQGESSETSYHIQHILIAVPEAALPAQVQMALAKLKSVQTALDNGIPFTEVAAQYSDGQNALEGGDIGWRKQGELPSIFANVVPVLVVGETTKPIRSGSGYHLVKLVEERDEEIHLVKQTLASHILIKTDAVTTDDQAENRLELLRERILNGEDFAALARANSDDSGSAVEGGSLGWASPGMMVPEFDEQMEALEPGEVGEVFKSRFGWHLIKVYDRREENMAEEFKRGQARAQIRKRKTEEKLENWLRQLRDEAYVEYRDL